MDAPTVPCQHCGASRNRHCVNASGRTCPTHKNRLLLADAPAPPAHPWQGFAYRIRCEVCQLFTSVDLTGVIIAHPTKKGDEWCPQSHQVDIDGKKVEWP